MYTILTSIHVINIESLILYHITKSTLLSYNNSFLSFYISYTLPVSFILSIRMKIENPTTEIYNEVYKNGSQM